LGRRANRTTTQLLIHQKAHSPADATWEFADDFKLRFLDFNLEDKVGSKGGQLSGAKK